jgi:hypothetical protein
MLVGERVTRRQSVAPGRKRLDKVQHLHGGMVSGPKTGLDDC